MAVIDLAFPDHWPSPVELTDCPACLSAGSVRRGVCDICGTEIAAGDSNEDLVPA
jgi:hypothetical protein